jgi:D-arabinose 1-dehydrogenase-like Zn-dependent alcohol dehydrogenase
VVGIGGLGHLALKFANAWGCEVTAFTSTDSKAGLREFTTRWAPKPRALSALTTAQMLDFAARHKILPQTEHFPIAKVNDAIQHLLEGNARYRVVLDMA